MWDGGGGEVGWIRGRMGAHVLAGLGDEAASSERPLQGRRHATRGPALVAERERVLPRERGEEEEARALGKLALRAPLQRLEHQRHEMTRQHGGGALELAVVGAGQEADEAAPLALGEDVEAGRGGLRGAAGQGAVPEVEEALGKHRPVLDRLAVAEVRFHLLGDLIPDFHGEGTEVVLIVVSGIRQARKLDLGGGPHVVETLCSLLRCKRARGDPRVRIRGRYRISRE